MRGFDMSGAIVHEWVEKIGGSERVLDQMAATFPDADIYALWSNEPGRYHPRSTHESWLSRTPLRGRKSLALPVMPVAWRTMQKQRDYDWVLVSSHAFAHQVRFRGKATARKYVYAHTPARYIWARDLDSRGAGLTGALASAVLRPIDRHFAQEAERLAANSRYVAERISRAWERESSVIYPPVRVTTIESRSDWSQELGAIEARLLAALPETFVLAASRFVPYKRLDLAILAADRVGVPIVVAGAGPDRDRLAAIASEASVPVTFVTSPSDELLLSLYQRAQAFIFPAIEDFGIMPVEAIAAGCPVVAVAEGGASESVIDGVNGFVSSEQTLPGLADATEKALSLHKRMPRGTVASFDELIFRDHIRRFVEVSDSR